MLDIACGHAVIVSVMIFGLNVHSYCSTYMPWEDGKDCGVAQLIVKVDFLLHVLVFRRKPDEKE